MAAGAARGEQQPAATPTQQTQHREASVLAFKRHLLRQAAREVFAEVGLAGASVRRITATAGYTTSALYTYYGGKEELYADLLRSSMEELLEELTAAGAGAGDGDPAARVLGALLDFYRRRPRDFDLAFHLHGGARPRGISPDLDRQLNQQMRGVVGFIGEALVASGRAAPESTMAVASMAVSHVFGLVLMANTGRLAVLGGDPQQFLTAYLDPDQARPERG